MPYHVIYSEERTTKNKNENQTDNVKLVNSIMNVEWNIFDYKERKKHCKNCPMKKTKQTCQDCTYSIPDIIHLKIMQNRKKELWKEYNHRHKGEIRWNGTVI
jgi:hypothetical protein